MSDYSIYPKAIDGYAQIPLAVDKRSPINAESVNRLRSGIINIEKAIGVAPEFSEEFGSFPDLASRIDGLEGKLVEDASLTGLYQKDNVLQLDEEPLILQAQDGSLLEFAHEDNSFVIASSTGLELEPGGLVPNSGPPPWPIEWPRSVVIKRSDTMSIEVGDLGESTNLNTYLSFGGEIDESDLAIIKIEPKEGSLLEPFWGGLTGLVAGAKAAMDETVNPSTFFISCFETLKPGVGGQSIEISAGASLHEADPAGSVTLSTGEHPTSSGADIHLEGGSDGDPSSIRMRGEIAIEGDLEAKGNVGVLQDFSVDGNATMQDVSVNGATFLQGVNVDGTASLQNAVVFGDLGVNQNVNVNQDVTVGGSTSLQNLNVNGSTGLQSLNVNQDLTVAGTTILQNGTTCNDSLTVNSETKLEGITKIECNNNLPAVGEILAAKATSGEVEWVSPSQYVSGTAMNVGDQSTTNIKQVIFTDPTSGAANNAGCWIVPMDITIDSIFIKWVGDNSPVIAVGRDLTWNLGILADANGSPDIGNTTPYNNFSPYGNNPISALEVTDTDSGSFFYKTATGLDYDVDEGEILVINHHLAGADWTLTAPPGGTAAAGDVTVTIKFRQRYS